MDNNQQQLVYLLSSAIRGQKVENNKISNLNWKVVLEYAKKQDIYSIIFPLIKNIDTKYRPDKEFMDEWKRQTILAGMTQIQNINKVSTVLRRFYEEGIKVMALKGLVLRDFYPFKELRTMGDTDLLIQEENRDKAKKILLQMGYIEHHSDLKHAVFLHEKFLPIEMHWLLIDTNHFKYAEYLEKSIWESVDNINICGVKVLVPSLENQILYLLLHMAVHFIYSGFGLRQLSDLILLVEARKNEINWDHFVKSAKYCKIDNFAVVIFHICRKLFGLEVYPKYPKVYDTKLLNNKYIDMIIDNIFTGGAFDGVFGKTNVKLSYGNLVSYYENQNQCNKYIGKLKYLIGLLLPPPQRLKESYKYIRKYPILLPIAWVHRLVYCIIRKDYSVDEKKVLLSGNLYKIKEKNELFEWLNLQ